MAETMQSISNTLIEEAKRYYTASSSELKTEDNLSLLFSVADSLNVLYINLEKLDHALKMKNLELRINKKYKGESSPHSGAV